MSRSGNLKIGQIDDATSLDVNAVRRLGAAAKVLLDLYEDRLAFSEEWNNLAIAWSAVQSLHLSRDRTYKGLLQSWTVACCSVARQSLRQFGVPFDERKVGPRTDFDVTTVSTTQYVRVIERLMEAGAESVDWRFALFNRETFG